MAFYESYKTKTGKRYRVRAGSKTKPGRTLFSGLNLSTAKCRVTEINRREKPRKRRRKAKS